MSETRLIPGGKSRTLRNTGFAYSPPCFPAQNSALFFCRKEEEFQQNSAGRGGSGDARKGVRRGPKPHTQPKRLAPAWEEKPGLGGRF